jgi:hypothetical protein
MLRTLKAWPGYLKNIFIYCLFDRLQDIIEIEEQFDQIESINRNKVEVRRGWIKFPLLVKKSTYLVTKALYRYIGNYKINKKNLLPEIKQSRNFRKYYPRLNILQLSSIYTCSTKQKRKSILNEIEIS